MKSCLIFSIFLTGIFCLLIPYAYADSSEAYKIQDPVEPSLSEKIKLIPPETMVRVIITLRNQPYGAVKKDLDERYKSRINDLRMRLESISRLKSIRDVGLEEINAESSIRAVLRDIKSLNNRIISEAYSNAKVMVDEIQRAVISQIESIGGEVNYRYVIVNSISAVIPAEGIKGLSTLIEIAMISEDRRMKADLNASIPSIFADTWWNNGYTGGIFDAAVVDSGMDTGHPAFSGKTFVNSTFHTTALTDACYNDDPASTDDLYGHGTHVGGIVMSRGSAECPACRGVARGLDRTFNLKAAWLCTNGLAYMYNSDAMAAVEWAESQGDSPDVYNLSYSGATSSDDSAFAQFWDAVVSMNGKPVALSAGNTGPSNTDFNDPAISYNAVTVANINDYNNTGRSDDVISNSSSRGPTASGRKKPDVAAPGTRISSANYWWEVDYDFADATGTSMSAPHAAGAFTLLQDYMGSGPASSLRQKALLINTADSWSDNGTVSDPSDDGPVAGKHWDQTYGWGYMNLNEAYIHRDDTFSDSLTTADNYKLYKGQLSDGDKATVAWNRRVVYNNADYPAVWYALSDINLYLYQENDGSLIDSSLSTIDNVEQIAPASTEDIVLKVKLSGSPDGTTSEPYGLAIDGSLTQADFNAVLLNTASPVVCPDTAFNLNQAIMNYGDIYSHNHSVSLATPAGWTQNTLNPQTSGSLQPNRRGNVSWSMTSPSSGTGSFSINWTSGSYGETLTMSAVNFTIGVKSSSFTDVPCTHPFYGWIEKMKDRGITAGCSLDLYCPGNPVTRKQMAVFIITAMGEAQSTATYNAYFSDIADDAFAPYINRMYELSITAGCGTGVYCPENPVTRGQTAVFITAAKGWTIYTPANPSFTDLPATDPFYGFIERLWREGITSGCSASEYCPGSDITREQMAVFIIVSWL